MAERQALPDLILAFLEKWGTEKERRQRRRQIERFSAGGRPIGSNDLLIAAHTLALDLILVTDNVDEFARAPGLSIENWPVA